MAICELGHQAAELQGRTPLIRAACVCVPLRAPCAGADTGHIQGPQGCQGKQPLAPRLAWAAHSAATSQLARPSSATSAAAGRDIRAAVCLSSGVRCSSSSSSSMHHSVCPQCAGAHRPALPPALCCAAVLLCLSRPAHRTPRSGWCWTAPLHPPPQCLRSTSRTTAKAQGLAQPLQVVTACTQQQQPSAQVHQAAVCLAGCVGALL